MFTKFCSDGRRSYNLVGTLVSNCAVAGRLAGPMWGREHPINQCYFERKCQKRTKMRFLQRVTFVFQGIFHPEGGEIWQNRGQKMYAKFYFLQDGAGRAQLALKLTELQLVCGRSRPSPAEKVCWIQHTH